MAVVEKQAPRLLSYGSMALGVLVSGWFWYAGAQNPAVYTSQMTINHHGGGYGVGVSCYGCHVPVGSRYGFTTAPTCLTAGCHAGVNPATEHAAAIEQLKEGKEHLPDAAERAQFAYELHEAYKGAECWECHTEHTSRKKVVPPGWTFDQWKARRTTGWLPGWRSVKGPARLPES